MKNIQKKNGQITLQGAPGIILTVVVVALTAAVGLLVLNSISISGSFTGAPANAINNFTALVTNLSVLMPVLGTILGASLIIGVVIFAFIAMRR